jgi:hypothetical protein
VFSSLKVPIFALSYRFHELNAGNWGCKLSMVTVQANPSTVDKGTVPAEFVTVAVKILIGNEFEGIDRNANGPIIGLTVIPGYDPSCTTLALAESTT